MSPEIVGAIIGALISGLITGITTWSITKSYLNKENSLQGASLRDSNQQINKLKSELSSTQEQVNTLSHFETKYKEVKRKLQASSVVREYLRSLRSRSISLR